MASSDLNIDELAAYLHLTPPQVQRMADRGKLPGRKLAGQWRFSEAEVHAWLEQQIGASDQEGLVKVQADVDRWTGRNKSPAATDELETISLSDLFSADAIEVPIAARTRTSVVRRMCQLAEQTGILWDAAKMTEAVLAREELHSTALDNGVALLHPRRPQVSILGSPMIALGVSSQPLPFGNQSGHLTDIFFLICSIDDRQHLQTLAKLSKLLTGTELIQDLRHATSSMEAFEAIQKYELDIPLNA